MPIFLNCKADESNGNTNIASIELNEMYFIYRAPEVH